MTDMPNTVANVRRILQDRPLEVYITTGIDADDTDIIVSDITKFQKGTVWEFGDGGDGAELILIRDTDEDTSTISVKREHEDSSATTHDADTVLFKDPRFRYNLVAQGIGTVIDTDLYHD